MSDNRAAFFGFMGIALTLVLSVWGAAYGTAKSGVGMFAMGLMDPDEVMKNLLPVVMAGVLGIYGLIIAITLNQKMSYTSYEAYLGWAHLAAGLTCGLSCLGSGMAVGIVGDAGTRTNGQQPRFFVGMVLILIFAGAPGLYGMIVAIYLSQVKAY